MLLWNWCIDGTCQGVGLDVIRRPCRAVVELSPTGRRWVATVRGSGGIKDIRFKGVFESVMAAQTAVEKVIYCSQY